MILLLVLCASCGFSLMIMPVIKNLASRNGLIDQPDGRRKIHARPIPLAGGLGILASVIVAVVLALLLSESLYESFQEERLRLMGLLLASIGICAIGVADDYRCLRGKHKLCGQIIMALILIQFGWVVRSVVIFGWQLELGILAVPCTMLWILGAINSLNLIDGMDGLLGTMGLILCLALAGLAAYAERWSMACVALGMSGAIVGFLCYNFPPASVFLGDAGSMLIGLVIGALCLPWEARNTGPVPLIVPVAFLTLPIFDSAAAIIRRKLTGRSIYCTDRAHLHHCYLRHGFSARHILMRVAVLCGVCVTGGLASMATGQEIIALISALIVVSYLIATRTFGTAEMVLLRNQMHDGFLSFLKISAPSGGREMVIRLQGAVDWKELWDNFLAGSRRLNLVLVRLDVNAPALHEGYHARWDSPYEDREESSLWSAEIPLRVHGHVLGRVEVLGIQDEVPIRDKVEDLMTLVDYFEMEAADRIKAHAHPPALEPALASVQKTVEAIESVSTPA